MAGNALCHMQILDRLPQALTVTFSFVGAAGIKLGGLQAFETGGFDLESHLHNLSEKGIDLLRTELAALDVECAEELRKSVHSNYMPYVTASQAGAHSILVCVWGSGKDPSHSLTGTYATSMTACNT